MQCGNEGEAAHLLVRVERNGAGRGGFGWQDKELELGLGHGERPPKQVRQTSQGRCRTMARENVGVQKS